VPQNSLSVNTKQPSCVMLLGTRIVKYDTDFSLLLRSTAKRINYDLLPKSSLDTCLNILIANPRLPMLINRDCIIVRETPENILLHIKL
jgi:hypothetical protein